MDTITNNSVPANPTALLPAEYEAPGRIPFTLRETVFVCCVLAAALAWHGWQFLTGRWVLDGDECYLAIQGLNILKGARPVFYYGQNYMGCIEAYAFAFFRLLTGASTPLTVKLQGAVQMLLYLISSYFLVRRFFGRRIALYTLLLLAFPPNMLSLWYGKIRGYMPALLLGNCILYTNMRRDSAGSPILHLLCPKTPHPLIGPIAHRMRAWISLMFISR